MEKRSFDARRIAWKRIKFNSHRGSLLPRKDAQKELQHNFFLPLTSSSLTRDQG